MPLNSAAGAQDAGSGRHGWLGGVLPACRAARSSRLSCARIAAVSACVCIIRARVANTGMSAASEEMLCRLTHASAGVPPHVESISPMGTASRRLNSRPKK